MLAGGARPAWMGYLYTPDVDATIAAIEADGGAVHMPATDLPVGRLAMLSDPQGAVFYVMNPIPPAGMEDRDSDVFSVTEAQHVRWNELRSEEQTSEFQTLMRISYAVLCLKTNTKST